MPWDLDTIPTLFQGPRYNNNNSLLLLVLLLLPPHQPLTQTNPVYSLVVVCLWNYEKHKQPAYAKSARNCDHAQTISLTPTIRFVV